MDVAVLDFSKAFDKVLHTRLMSKLRLLGIEGNISRWIKAFLSERTQRVCVDGHLSTKADVKSGVPQGTILGPLLFLCFINYLPSVGHPDTQVRLFADDRLVYRGISSTEDQLKFQEDLHSLATWGLQWGMRFNTDKCHILTVSASAQPLSKLYEIDGSSSSTLTCSPRLPAGSQDWRPLSVRYLNNLKNIESYLTKNCMPNLGITFHITGQ